MILAAIALFWALALWAMAGAGGRRLVYLFFVVMPFGSFAVVPTTLTAGLTLTPVPIVAALMVLRVALLRRGLDRMLTLALARRGALTLTLFWIVAVVVTAFMPLLFAGRIAVVPVRVTGADIVPLYPSAQNLSQLAYLTLSVLTVLALAVLLRSAEMRRHALAAIALGAAVAVATGALDYLSSWLPVAPLLAPFRTASYALLVDTAILGSKRVVGLMPEASSYGDLCLSLLVLLYFFRRAMAGAGLRAGLVPVLMALLVACIWLSTSSAAYVGLVLFGLTAAMEWSWRAGALRPGDPGRRGLPAEFWAAAAAFLALIAIILFVPRLLDPVVALFDRMVLQKSGSSSFAERNMWTAVTFRALVDSYGLGIGIGSSRASNAAVALVASSGVLGGALYFGFVAQSLRRRAPGADPEAVLLLRAVRWSFLPIFAVSLLIATTPDFGPVLAFLYAVAAAASGAVPGAARAPGLIPRPG
jgi:hypothetical protein